MSALLALAPRPTARRSDPSSMPDFSVILPAAGSSSRFGGPVSKLFQPLAGLPVLAWTVRAFAARNDVPQIVIPSHDRPAVEQSLQTLPQSQQEKILICPGGDCRAGSVRAGIEASLKDIEWIAVHDAARPLVSSELIDRVLAAAVIHGAAAAAMPAHLTIKQAAGPLPARVQRTIPRRDLWAMQTPQIARRADYLRCFATCPVPLAEVTDDMQLLELQDLPVWLVQGEERNLKITTPTDISLADLWSRSLVPSPGTPGEG